MIYVFATLRSQFHYGSIQIFSSCSHIHSDPGVSIPLWFDSNQSIKDGEAGTKKVSIPLWFDSNVIQFSLISQILKVSIPLWFDSNSFELFGSDVGFNVSIPLWFDSNNYNERHKTKYFFSLNSTMVRFKSYNPPKK